MASPSCARARAAGSSNHGLSAVAIRSGVQASWMSSGATSVPATMFGSPTRLSVTTRRAIQ
jgi:hypothetical protein